MRTKVFIVCLILFFMSSYVYCSNVDSILQSNNKKKLIAGYIQLLSPLRFGNNLKVGDRVEYQYISNTESQMTHSLEVVSKDDRNMVILEKFEGNDVYVRIDSSSKAVSEIWGTDEFGENQRLTILSSEQLQVFENEVNELFESINSIMNYDECFYLEAQTEKKLIQGKKKISTFEVKVDIQKTNIPTKLVQSFKDENKLILSNEVPKMLPLIPVALASLNKKNIISQNNYGFIENNVLKLRSYNK